MSMRHHVPGEFVNETKWLKFFGTKQLILIGVGAAVTYVCYKVSTFFGLGGAVGILTGLVLGIIIVAPSMIPIPETQFLKGAGSTVDVIFVRWLIRRRKRVIYIRGWKKDREG